MTKITEKLIKIQTELKAPKNLYNSFGKYKYRNAEGICEAVKPYLKAQGCALFLTDDIVQVGDRIYVKATASFVDVETNGQIDVSAFAREPESKKGMDDSQITGTASSYARKYALNGLFLLDDTKDADTDEHRTESENRAKKENKAPEQKTTPKQKSTPEQAKNNILEERCKKDSVNVAKLCQLYKVDSIAKMNEKQLDNAIKNWDKIKGMCK